MLHATRYTMVLLMLATHAVAQETQPGDEPQMPTRAASILSSEYRYFPTVIEAEPGDQLLLSITNVGKVPHSVAVLLPTGVASMQGVVMPGATRQLPVRVPQQPGVYPLVSPIGNHTLLGMVGALRVRHLEDTEGAGAYRTAASRADAAEPRRNASATPLAPPQPPVSYQRRSDAAPAPASHAARQDRPNRRR